MSSVACCGLTHGPPVARRMNGHTSIAPETSATAMSSRLLRMKSTGMCSTGADHYNSAHAPARAPAPRRIGLEPREPLHRLDRRRSVAGGAAGGARRRAAAPIGRPSLRSRLHLGAQARDPHAVDRARGARPHVDPGREELAAERAPLRRAAGAEQGGDGGEIRRGAGARLAAQLRHAAAGARGRRSAERGARSALRRRARPGERMPQGHRGARRAVLGEHARARDPLRAAGAGRGARQLPARAGQVPGRRQRPRHRRAQHPDRGAARVRARRGPAAAQALLPRGRRRDREARRLGRGARESQSLKRLALLLLMASAGAAFGAEREQDLQSLRTRIDALSRSLQEKEEQRSEARDALRASERAISEANRALAAAEAESARLRVESGRIAERRAQVAREAVARQAGIERMLLARQSAGTPDALRVLLSGDDPGLLAHELHYLPYVSGAAAELLRGYRAAL